MCEIHTRITAPSVATTIAPIMPLGEPKIAPPIRAADQAEQEIADDSEA